MNDSAFHHKLGHAFLFKPTHNVTLPTISRLQEDRAHRDDSPDNENLLAQRKAISGIGNSSQSRNLGLGGGRLGYFRNVDDIVSRRSRCNIEFVARNGRFSKSV
jgi:hypothetical protein